MKHTVSLNDTAGWTQHIFRIRKESHWMDWNDGLFTHHTKTQIFWSFSHISRMSPKYLPRPGPFWGVGSYELQHHCKNNSAKINMEHPKNGDLKDDSPLIIWFKTGKLTWTQSRGGLVQMILLYNCVWSNYSNLPRPISTKWWFSKGNPLFQGNLYVYVYIYI